MYLKEKVHLFWNHFYSINCSWVCRNRLWEGTVNILYWCYL